MPVEILHDAVGGYKAGQLVDASAFGSGELRRLLELKAVRMVPCDSPEKPVELTPEQQAIVQANSELADRLEELEKAHQEALAEIARWRQEALETQQQAQKLQVDLGQADALVKRLQDDLDAALRPIREEIDAKVKALVEETLRQAPGKNGKKK